MRRGKLVSRGGDSRKQNKRGENQQARRDHYFADGRGGTASHAIRVFSVVAPFLSSHALISGPMERRRVPWSLNSYPFPDRRNKPARYEPTHSTGLQPLMARIASRWDVLLKSCGHHSIREVVDAKLCSPVF